MNTLSIELWQALTVANTYYARASYKGIPLSGTGSTQAAAIADLTNKVTTLRNYELAARLVDADKLAPLPAADSPNAVKGYNNALTVVKELI